MDTNQLLEKAIPYAGGQDNVVRATIKPDMLYMAVKDAGAVDRLALQQIGPAVSVEITRNRVILRLQETTAEETIMAKKDYGKLADDIITLVGGKENISYLAHCITRLRFTLKNKDLVQNDKISALSGIVGAQWSGDQYQIIIGAAVNDVYDAVCEKADIAQQPGIEENLDKAPKKKFSAAVLLDAITGSIAPIIPVMIACGMLKAVLQILTYTNLMSAEGSTYAVLSFVGDVGFYFLPVIIGYTAAKKFGCNVFIGMALGACLIHPNFTALVSAGEPITLFGLPVYAGSYASSIFPMILTMAVCAQIEKFFTRIIPATLRYILVPTFTLVVSAPLELIVLAPLGSYAGSYLASAVVWLYNTTGFVGCAILAAIYPLIIMTGMHTATSPYIFSALGSYGYEPLILPTMHISNFNQIAACVAVGIKAKDGELKQSAFSCAITALIGGVTEPALFGVTIPLKTPLYACMIGGVVGGALVGLKKVVVYTLPGAGTLFGLPAYIGGGSMSNLIWMIICILVGMAVTFAATLILYKPAKK